MRLNTKSMVFKSAIIFLLLTVLNITIFTLMVFENQVDLIIDNAVLNSQIIASRVQFQIEETVAGLEIIDQVSDDFTLSSPLQDRIYRVITAAGVENFTLYNEDGRIMGHYIQGAEEPRDQASFEEHSLISEAITRREFVVKPYTQNVLAQDQTINLYIPFLYGEDEMAVTLLSRRMVDIPEQMGFLYRQVLFVALLILLLHGAYAYFINLQIFKPLGTLLRGARSISSGDLETRVSIVREDEIGELSNAFNEMSVAIRNMHDEARGANPLTGLPGNITIANKIDERLAAGDLFAVLYSDLDNFKAYNDKYGFSKGDEAINYVKECLLASKEALGEQDVFVGHEGGDDFVTIVDYSHWRNFAQSFLERFDSGVHKFYSEADSKNGYIDSVNRQGQKMRFPLMSISVAVVSNKSRRFAHHAEIVQVAAEVKKLAKKKEGSHYVEDTRGQQGESGVIIKAVE
jgi:diguanylate cyclase (GGDEF)-like protein